MTYEELEFRMARGERIGHTVEVHDAIAALMGELRRMKATRGGEAESAEQAWEHEGEEYQEYQQPRRA